MRTHPRAAIRVLKSSDMANGTVTKTEHAFNHGYCGDEGHAQLSGEEREMSATTKNTLVNV